MKRFNIFSQEWCDIVFRNRNKDYGAYYMRSTTPKRYLVSLACLFGLLIVLCTPLVIQVIRSNMTSKVNLDESIRKIARFEGLRLKEARPQRRAPRHELPKDNDDPDAQTQTVSPETPPVATIEHNDNVEYDEDKIEDLPPDSISTLIKESELELAQGRQQTQGVIVDTIPRYPTGINDFMRWLNSQMVYPELSQRRGEEGVVEVAFIVEPDGSIVDIHIESGVSRDLNREVLRVLKKMPNWLPAKKNGKPIRAQVTLPVQFQLNQERYR